MISTLLVTFVKELINLGFYLTLTNEFLEPNYLRLFDLTFLRVRLFHVPITFNIFTI
jgi:hypothetical protein